MHEAFLPSQEQQAGDHRDESVILALDEAKATLRRMVDAGKLALQGEKKGAYYTLAERQSLIPLAGQELIEKICGILRTRVTATLQEIDDDLARQGFEVAGNNKRNYLTAIMSRNKTRFKGLGRGSYMLSTEE